LLELGLFLDKNNANTPADTLYAEEAVAAPPEIETKELQPLFFAEKLLW
tara:strand:+ start:114 stop:260 length:147 start_codon:yes stop_codon:yes gene_type:complete